MPIETRYFLFKINIYFIVISKKPPVSWWQNTIYVRKIYGFEITGRKP